MVLLLTLMPQSYISIASCSKLHLVYAHQHQITLLWTASREKAKPLAGVLLWLSCLACVLNNDTFNESQWYSKYRPAGQSLPVRYLAVEHRCSTFAQSAVCFNELFIHMFCANTTFSASNFDVNYSTFNRYDFLYVFFSPLIPKCLHHQIWYQQSHRRMWSP